MKLKRKFIKAHMNTARNYSELSHCTRLKVGAILVKNNNPIAIGYNGRPTGEPNVGETADGLTHPDVRHAEVNALKKVTRSTESSVGSVMFVTHAPCRQCAIDMVDAGVTTVFFREEYKDHSGLLYLMRHDVSVYMFDPLGRLFKAFWGGSNKEGTVSFLYRSEEQLPEIEV